MQMKPLLAIMISFFSVQTLTAKNPNEAKELFVYESGTQHTQTIVFLHGSGSSSNMWLKHFAVLDSSFHCIAPDLPGHGRSNHIEWSDLDNVADVIAELIKTKGKGKVHVVGLSLGGSLIYKLLDKYPDLIDKAIIDGASAVPIKGSSFVIFGVNLTSPFLKTNMMIKIMAKSIGIPEEEFASFKEDISMVSRKSFRRAMSQANRLKVDLKNCTYCSPTFFVSGETESENMHNSHQVLSKKIPNSECAFYPGKGHAWMVSDIHTHIQLIKYWFLNNTFPGLLKSF
jgi:pimeloyl-ACP methyl ester carboxylesterase